MVFWSQECTPLSPFQGFNSMSTFILPLALILASGAWADDKPAAPVSKADEPLAPALSLHQAAQFLDATSREWTETKKCGSCHTNYPFLMARTGLREADAPSLKMVRAFLEERAANWDTRRPRWDTEVVATASVLAFDDAQTTGHLQPVSRQALDRMWTLQRPDGSWNWLKCNWPPLEADDYYGVVFASLCVGIAPDSYAATPKSQAGLSKIKAYLKEHPAPSLHHKAFLLWASQRLPELMATSEREQTITELRSRQRADGGWSLPSLGDWKRHSGEANDPDASSDGYATGLVVTILRQVGVAKADPTMVKGISWLKTNQRQSGQWFTRSPSNDKYHYISRAGTAFAVMALAACRDEKAGVP
jgi:squalene-hopene/tetraprenyl-beta-curcumene cyclase